MSLSHDHRRALRSRRVALVKDLKVDEIFMSVMIKGNMFTIDNKEEIMANPTRMTKSSKFLEILERRGEDGFDLFIEALIETDQRHIAQQLDPHHDLLLTKELVNWSSYERIEKMRLNVVSRKEPQIVFRKDDEDFQTKDIYSLKNNEKHGLAIVVNYSGKKDFSNLTKILEKLFEGLHLDCKSLSCDNENDLYHKLEKMVQNGSDSYQAFVIFMFSTTQAPEIRRITKPFCVEKYCKMPKLFFLQTVATSSGDVNNSSAKGEATALNDVFQMTFNVNEDVRGSTLQDFVYTFVHVLSSYAWVADIRKLGSLMENVMLELRRKAGQSEHLSPVITTHNYLLKHFYFNPFEPH